jgi:hypothetical protein
MEHIVSVGDVWRNFPIDEVIHGGRWVPSGRVP